MITTTLDIAALDQRNRTRTARLQTGMQESRALGIPTPDHRPPSPHASDAMKSLDLPRMIRVRLLVAALIVGVTGHGVLARGARDEANPVLHWNRIAGEIVPRETGPVLEARAMAMLHAAIHDAINGVERRYQPYAVDLSFPGASIDAAVATAAHDLLLAVAPNQQQRLEDAYAVALGSLPAGAARDAGVAVGRAAARAILERRSADGIVPGPFPPREGPITQPVYVPTGQPGDYAFTPPFDAPPLGPIALFPGWGRLAPFAIDLAKHRVHGPDPLDSRRYARDVEFVKKVGRLQSSARTDDQAATAFFWFEPPPIWNDIARTVLARHHADPWKAARVLALMNFALADAEIAGFAAKYEFRFWRPYTAIRRAAEDGNDGTDADPDWLPLLWSPPGTPPVFFIPPIPDYPSLAATGSAAAAAVLTRHVGRRVEFDAAGVTLPGATRHFRSFAQAAEEAAMSRVFGGIHFLRAVHDGLVQGRGIGREVSRMLPPLHGGS